MKQTLLIITSLMLVVGCSQHSFTKTSFTQPRAPQMENCTIVVLQRFPVDMEYEELGICHASVPGGGIIADNTPKAINELKKCACLNGGNAIVMRPGNIKSTGLSGMEFSQQKVEASATVIYVIQN